MLDIYFKMEGNTLNCSIKLHVSLDEQNLAKN